MSFPTTGILDNFNRANVGPPPSASWSQAFSGVFGQFKVVSNRAAVNSLVSGYAENYYNAASYGGDCEAYVTIVTKPANTTIFGLGIRMVDLVGAVNPDGYMLFLSALSGTDTLQIDRIDNGVRNILGTAVSQEVSNGDAIGIRAIGSALTCWYKASGGSWTQLFSRTDATYSAAGRIEIITTSAATVLDDFGGGTYVPYTLALGTGSHALSGQAVTLKAARVLPLAQASFVHSGQAVALKVSRTLALAHGTHTLTGQAVGILAQRALPLANGAYALAGQDVTLTKTGNAAQHYTMTLANGAYSLTGQSANLTTARLLALGHGAYTLTGQAVGMQAARTMALAHGGYSLSGQTMAILQGRKLSIDHGGYTLTGETMALRVARMFTLSHGNYILTGQDIDLSHFGGIVTTPLERKRIIEAESRKTTITAESRTHAIEAETRLQTIGADPRTFAVEAENRIIGV